MGGDMLGIPAIHPILGALYFSFRSFLIDVVCGWLLVCVQVIANTKELSARQRELYATTNENFKEIREVFTQGQLAQFFAWCESNELCVNALMGASP